MKRVAAPQIASLLAASFAALAFSACKSSSDVATVPLRDCSVVVWHKPASASAHVEIVGDYNGWARPGITPVLASSASNGWYAAKLPVGAGEHTYAIVEDGTWLTDANVPTTAFVNGQEVTWLDVPDCSAPAVTVDGVDASANGTATIRASFFAASDARAIDPKSVTATASDGTVFPVTQVDASTGAITIASSGLKQGKYTVAIDATDSSGKQADDAIATVWIEPRPFDPRDLQIYQVIVDRFMNASGALPTPSDPAGRAGGTLDGLRAFIESGQLAALGFNAVWISPLYENPSEDFAGNDGHMYSSYHGYWPSAPRGVEPLLGDEAEIDAFVAAAHANDIRVIFDVVPNHVHTEHPYFTQHPDWFDGSSSCVCGVGSCDWATYIQTCWFAPYLADLDWTNAAVATQITSDVRWWLDRFDGDGLRIDAVPMMPRAASRRIAFAARQRFDHPGNKTFILGENFTGPGAFDLLKYDLGPQGLDSEFHFPLMWTIRGAIADGTEPMSDLDATVAAGEAAWAGSGATMSLIIGNHDVSRFSSESAGNADGDTWTPAPQAVDPLVYEKQSLAFGAIYTLPGVPVVYYGDEIGLAGRADPDSRRVYPAESQLSDNQKSTRAALTKLAQARSCSGSLRHGTYRLLYADAETWIYARENAGDATAVVVLARSPVKPFEGPLSGISTGDFVDALSGAHASLSSELTKLSPGSFSVAVYLPAGSACAP